MNSQAEWFKQWGIVEDDVVQSAVAVHESEIAGEISDSAFRLLILIKYLACHGFIEKYSLDDLAKELRLSESATAKRLHELRIAGYLDPFLGSWVNNAQISHVYFIQSASGSGPIKIGKARDVTRRLASLQTGNHDKLHVIGVIENGGGDLERSLHEQFAKYRLHGEWFSPADELIEYIRSINSSKY